MRDKAKARRAKAASDELVGKKITRVRYMTEGEVRDLGWSSAAVVIILDDDTLLYPSRDDEGNDAGALFTTIETLPVLGVF